jgi:hypothetical protein
MDISLGLKFWGLEGVDGGRRIGWPVSYLILLTELRHVNRPERKIAPQRIQNGALGGFGSSLHALELTVAHKTVAEPH